MKEFATNDHANYYYGITNITVNGKNAYELKGRFLEDLHNNAFSGTYGEDAIKHIEFFLKIFDLINFPNVNHDRLRVAIFPISLVGKARSWFNEISGSTTTWVDLTEIVFGKYYPPSRSNVVETKVKKDPTNDMFEEWLALKFANHMTMDLFTKNVLRDFWKKNDSNDEVINDRFSNCKEANNDDEQEIGEIFRIETNLFNYETPLCTKFNEFNYLLKIDPELSTYDVKGIETYDDYINKLDEEPEEPWGEDGVPYEIGDHICEPF
nr:hypothetical protein [Tanacetum cinerariifolium]